MTELGADFEDTLALLDRIRRKRNRATYDMVDTLIRKEADEAIAVAQAFVPEIARRVGE